MPKKSLFILIAILVIAGIFIIRFSTPEDTWLCQNGEWIKHGNPRQDKPSTTCSSLKPTNNSPQACTMEAKLCPDGSSVGRSGPNCEFTPCPE